MRFALGPPVLHRDGGVHEASLVSTERLHEHEELRKALALDIRFAKMPA